MLVFLWFTAGVVVGLLGEGFGMFFCFRGELVLLPGWGGVSREGAVVVSIVVLLFMARLL